LGKEVAVMNLGMVSYNVFVVGQANGWKGEGSNRVLLLQGPGDCIPFSSRSAEVREREGRVERQFDQLVESLSKIDKVVFYVGDSGGERAIELAAEHGLTPDRAIFVFCDCNIDRKRAIKARYGFTSSRVLNCYCGGHDKMKRIYDEFLSKGTLP